MMTKTEKTFSTIIKTVNNQDRQLPDVPGRSSFNLLHGRVTGRFSNKSQRSDHWLVTNHCFRCPRIGGHPNLDKQVFRPLLDHRSCLICQLHHFNHFPDHGCWYSL